jgi:hypothetical protein
MTEDMRSKLESMSVVFSLSHKDPYFSGEIPYIEEDKLKRIGEEIEHGGLSRWELTESDIHMVRLVMPRKELYVQGNGQVSYTDKSEGQEISHVSLANLTEHAITVLRRTSLKEYPFKNSVDFEFYLQKEFQFSNNNYALYNQIKEELEQFGRNFFHRDSGLSYEADSYLGSYVPLRVSVTPVPEKLQLYR